MGTVRGRAWEEQLLELAALLGWRRAHFRPLQTKDGRWRTPVSGDGAGFPDLVLVRGERLIVAEAKAGRASTTPEQRAWLDALDAVPGVEAYVWRPEQWDAIVATLR